MLLLSQECSRISIGAVNVLSPLCVLSFPLLLLLLVLLLLLLVLLALADMLLTVVGDGEIESRCGGVSGGFSVSGVGSLSRMLLGSTTVSTDALRE